MLFFMESSPNKVKASQQTMLSTFLQPVLEITASLLNTLLFKALTSSPKFQGRIRLNLSIVEQKVPVKEHGEQRTSLWPSLENTICHNDCLKLQVGAKAGVIITSRGFTPPAFHWERPLHPDLEFLNCHRLSCSARVAAFNTINSIPQSLSFLTTGETNTAKPLTLLFFF